MLTADGAKGLADSLLARAWAMRDRLVVRLAPELMDLAPGDVVQPAGVGGSWIVEQVSIEGMVVVANLRPAVGSLAGRVADPGRPVSQPDVVALPTVMALFDLSDLGEDVPSAPSLQLAAASPSGGYRALPIRVAINGVETAGQSASGEAVLGSAVGALATGQSAVIDLEASVEVVLANPDHWLQSCDDIALAAGANLAAIGDEIIQFGSAEPVAAGRFRLSRLLRGRRGSDWAMAGHVAGEPFVLIDARTLKAIPAGASGIGSAVTVKAYGRGNDGAEPVVSRVVQGEAARPLSPAQLAAEIAADGSLAVRWVRRSRRGWAWIDAVDVPADPDLAGYRITLTRSGAAVDYSVSDPLLALTAAQLAALGTGPLSIAARQVGSFGLSRPATLIINA